MKIESTNVFVGPNMFARFPVIRHVLDLGELEEWPTVRLGDAFVGALLTLLPGLQEHGCSYSESGGFVRRMTEDEGTWLGHVMEHVALELQNVAGSDVTFGRTRSIDGRPGFYNMVFQYKDAAVGRRASKLALDLLHNLLPAEIKPEDAPPADWNFAEQRDSFIRYAQRREFGPSTASLVKAAEAREYSLAATQQLQPGAVRTGTLSAAHSGDDDRPHQQYRRGARLRQGGDQRHPAGPRPAGAAAGAGSYPGRCRARRGAHRLSR